MDLRLIRCARAPAEDGTFTVTSRLGPLEGLLSRMEDGVRHVTDGRRNQERGDECRRSAGQAESAATQSHRRAEAGHCGRVSTAGSLRGGQRAAAVMNLIQSARLNGHDPYSYLKNVLERLPTQSNSRVEELLPHRRAPTAAQPGRG